MGEEKLSFQTEVSRLLRIVANSLYSEKRIFLRELISNASDACDRARYEAITEPVLIEDDPDFRVRIELDAAARTISVADNGIGMNREGLIADLGTIARSGTTAYLEAGLPATRPEDMALIGQFGVGFYSAFMVADRVEVISRRAGEDGAWRWAIRRARRVRRRRGRARGARHHGDAAYPRRRGRVPRARHPARHRQDLFGPHRAADRSRRGRQRGDRQRGLRALGPAAGGDRPKTSTRRSTAMSAMPSTSRG